MTFDVPLPSLVKQALEDRAAALLNRHAHRFGMAQMHLHLKHAGPQTECIANLFTDEGNYHASLTAWNVLSGIDAVLDKMHQQILKQSEKLASYA